MASRIAIESRGKTNCDALYSPLTSCNLDDAILQIVPAKDAIRTRSCGRSKRKGWKLRRSVAFTILLVVDLRGILSMGLWVYGTSGSLSISFANSSPVRFTGHTVLVLRVHSVLLPSRRYSLAVVKLGKLYNYSRTTVRHHAPIKIGAVART